MNNLYIFLTGAVYGGLFYWYFLADIFIVIISSRIYQIWKSFNETEIIEQQMPHLTVYDLLAMPEEERNETMQKAIGLAADEEFEIFESNDPIYDYPEDDEEKKTLIRPDFIKGEWVQVINGFDEMVGYWGKIDAVLAGKDYEYFEGRNLVRFGKYRKSYYHNWELTNEGEPDYNEWDEEAYQKRKYS